MGWIIDLLNRWRRRVPPTPTPGPPVTLSDLRRQLLDLHNAERSRVGLPSLAASKTLDSAAQEWAFKLAVRGVLSHGDFAERIDAAGYRWSRCAENIASSQETVAAVMRSWMGSSGHRGNIQGPYANAGFGVAEDAAGVRWWVTDFGTP